MPERTAIFDREISLLESREFDRIVSEISDSPGQSVFFCNVHMLMLSQEDMDLASAMNKADWIFADGVPVAWLQRRLSGKNCNVIRGYEIMLAVCERAATLGEKVGFIGSTHDVMSGLVNNLCVRFEGLPVAYQSCPPVYARRTYFNSDRFTGDQRFRYQVVVCRARVSETGEMDHQLQNQAKLPCSGRRGGFRLDLGSGQKTP